jgi:hypothetical protein
VSLNQQDKDAYGEMNEGDSVDFDAINSQTAWFLTEATGFIGPPARSARLWVASPGACGAEYDPNN